MPLNHLALLPDGNRRWAKKNNLTRYEGHHKGLVVRLPKIIDTCFTNNIHTVTIYPFSTENWSRQPDEVKELMEILDLMIDALAIVATKHKSRIVHLGRQDRLGANLIDKIDNLQKQTLTYDKHILNIALDYGGRDEILRAIIKFMDKTKPTATKQLIDKGLGAWLDTAGQPYPDPDFIIRTTEQRLSGFMAYQSTYSELYFPRVFWPDFTNKHLAAALREFSRRQRRYGH